MLSVYLLLLFIIVRCCGRLRSWVDIAYTSSRGEATDLPSFAFSNGRVLSIERFGKTCR